MTEENNAQAPEIQWDSGTAYEMFISLMVLHHPGKFGVRGAWAAGVRSRLPQADREFLEKVTGLFHEPYRWLYALPKPKDAATVLYTLRQIPAGERINALWFEGWDSPFVQKLEEVQQRGIWTEEDRDELMAVIRQGKTMKYSPKQLEMILGFFAESEKFGEQLLNALQVYHEVFFAEEEKRIQLKLEEGLARAQQMAGELSPQDLMEELSRGVRYEEMPEVERMVLAPSYWLTPLVNHAIVAENCMLWMFGARLAGEALVPGEIVPEDLLQALKALADPTRLKILRYLVQEQLTPAEISRRLRLRAPTVTHHLHTLRLAGLVRFVLKGKNERLYFARTESVKQVYAMLKKFLEEDESDVDSLDVLDSRRMM